MRTFLVAAGVAALSLGVVACGSSDNGGSTTASSASAPAAAAPRCGEGTGKKATGTPIKLGAIVTKQPGVDFTDITKLAQAYFTCVNDNGGVHGHPITYDVQPEQTDPQQIASLATKLIDSDKVVGIVGSTSLLDCSVNHRFYERKGYFAIIAGVPRECFTTPNLAAVNMGPYYSTVGAAQYLVRQGAKSLVADTNKAPGQAFNNQGALDLAKEKGIPGHSVQEVTPITDGPGVALRLTQLAGDGGGVILDFTPPEALKILQGAEQQGLIDKVKWACATPCNDASIAAALGPAWNGKLGINAELNLVDTNGPDTVQYRAVSKKYAPSVALGSFGQMGFLDAKIAVSALEGIQGDTYTAKAVNTAFHNVKDFKTDILCKPWYFGDGEQHVPNNADRTIVPQDHTFVQKEGCFDIAALPSNDLTAIRAAEAKSQ